MGNPLGSCRSKLHSFAEQVVVAFLQASAEVGRDSEACTGPAQVNAVFRKVVGESYNAKHSMTFTVMFHKS